MRIVIASISFCEYIIQQANALAALGHSVLLVTPGPLIEGTVGADIDHLLAPKVKYYTYVVVGKWRQSFYAGLFQAVSTFSPDVLHIHDNGEIETLALIMRFQRFPLVITVHDVTEHPGADSRIAPRRRWIKKFLKWRACRIHLHGERLREKFVEIHPRLASKIIVIPHGTLSLFKYWENGAVEREALTCLFFGRMEKYRGLDNLIKIGRILKETVPGIKIIVAGRGSELAKYRAEMSELGIFEIHDAFIPDREIFRYFRRASLLLLPYHEASQSGVVSVGFPFGVPVVATRVGSIPEVVVDGRQGKIISPGDIGGFADMVRELLSDREMLQQMSDCCLESAAHLDFRNLADNFVAVYSRAIAKKKAVL